MGDVEVSAHAWVGPVTDPGVAKPGWFRCCRCGVTAPEPQSDWSVCLGPHAAQEARAAWAIRPNAWSSSVDLTSSLVDWLLDPTTSPVLAFESIGALSAEDARDALAKVVERDLMRRARAAEDGNR